MNQLNSLILEGNLVEDMEITEPKNGFVVGKFSIAVNRFYKKKMKNGENINEVSFFDIESFGDIAVTLADKLKKGRGVRVVGRLKQYRWENSDGKSCSKVSIVAEHIEVKPSSKITESDSKDKE